MAYREQTVLDLFKSLPRSKKMHFEQDLCFIDSPTHSGSQYINCIKRSISLFFIPKCKFRCATICQSFHFFVRCRHSSVSYWTIPIHWFDYFQFISKMNSIQISRFHIYLLSGSRKFGRGGTTRRCSSMRSSLWAVTTMSAGSKHRKLPRVRILIF